MNTSSNSSSTPPPLEPPQPPAGKLGFKGTMKSKEVWKGIGLLALCHLVWLVFPLAYVAVGVVQIVYAVPLYIILYRKKQVLMAQGVLLGMGFTFLINATCFGIVLSQIGKQ